MQVNVSNLKVNLDKFDKAISDYELTYLNIYNELNNSRQYANSNKFTKFYNACDKEKLSTSNFYEEILGLKRIYQFVYQSYQSIGKLIIFDLDNSDTLYREISDIKNKLNDIKRKLYNINTSRFPEVSSSVNNSLRYISNILNDINSIELTYKNTQNKIIETEKRVTSKINNLNIDVITETDIKDFI